MSLLEEAGVDAIVELARRNPQNLYRQMKAINLEKKMVRKLPSLAQVQGWIEQTRALPRKITY